MAVTDATCLVCLERAVASTSCMRRSCEGAEVKQPGVRKFACHFDFRCLCSKIQTTLPRAVKTALRLFCFVHSVIATGAVLGNRLGSPVYETDATPGC